MASYGGGLSFVISLQLLIVLSKYSSARAGW